MQADAHEQPHHQGAQARHLLGHDAPHLSPGLEAGERGDDAQKGKDVVGVAQVEPHVAVQLQAGDRGQARGADAGGPVGEFGEVPEVEVDDVGGVDHVDGFDVDGATGPQQCERAEGLGVSCGVDHAVDVETPARQAIVWHRFARCIGFEDRGRVSRAGMPQSDTVAQPAFLVCEV